MWVALALLAGARAEDCYGAVAFEVTLDVETVPPGAKITVDRAPDPDFQPRSVGTTPIAWVYNYQWKWDEGDCDGAAPDKSWGAGPGHVVSSLDVYDTFAITATLEGYDTQTVPVRVDHCDKQDHVMKKALFGQLRKLSELRQCTMKVALPLTPSVIAPAEVAPTPLTADRMLLGCTTDKDCSGGTTCADGVCIAP